VTLTRDDNSKMGFFSVRKYWHWNFVVECFDKIYLFIYLFYNEPF
jgi:hypothetical protein